MTQTLLIFKKKNSLFVFYKLARRVRTFVSVTITVFAKTETQFFCHYYVIVFFIIKYVMRRPVDLDKFQNGCRLTQNKKNRPRFVISEKTKLICMPTILQTGNLN